ncbi:MAG: KAP family NTPase [Bacteroidales bacterium]|jgi:hypothetical protein|nr:KAP family NTPase [Bacteroidales bacterium]
MAEDKNKHITEYLEYYINLDNPQYAVLLTGEWGCGKTFYIKKLIEQWKKEDNDNSKQYLTFKPIYVSLNGIDNVSAINDKIRAEISPWLYSNGMKFAKNLAKGLIKGALKVDFGDNLSFDVDLLNIFSSREAKIKGNKILVFDDVERSKLEPDTIFGYINSFVEHLGCKVVLIADDTKFEGDNYKQIKEKLIGQTFKVENNIELALDEFIESCKCKSDNKEITLLSQYSEINNQKGLIVELFKASQHNNLRVLKQSLLDFNRFLTFIDDKYTKHPRYNEFLNSFLVGFLIVSIEIKMGNEKFWDYLPSVCEKKAEVQKKYDHIINYGEGFSLEAVSEYVQKGNIEKNILDSLLAKNKYFLSDKRENWERLSSDWWWLEKEEFEKLRDSVLEQFEKGIFKYPEVVIGTANVLLTLIHTKQLPNTSKENVVTQTKKVLNDIISEYIKANERVTLIEDMNMYIQIRPQDWICNEHKDILKYLVEVKNKVRDSMYENFLRDLFYNFKDEDFYMQLSQTTPDSLTSYNRTAIFKLIDGKKLAKHLQELPIKVINNFYLFIRDRYNVKENYYKDDLTCLTDCKTELKEYEQQEKESPKKLMLNKLIAGLDIAIENIRANRNA